MPEPATRPTIAIAADPADDAALAQRAAALGDELDLPVSHGPPTAELLLLVTHAGLALSATEGELAAGKPMRIDLTRLDTSTGPGRSLRQPLLRAVGIRRGERWRPRVIDATAGLGEDAWLLAAAGCRVEAVERHRVVAALLEDAIARARQTAPDAASRITGRAADSRAHLAALAGAELTERPDVVYLDPMFPVARRARERKPLRMLRRLVGDDADAGDLLAVALAAATRRVVVKRPGKVAALTERAPSATHRGRAVRYDVYAAAV
ncbi:MAG: class I SAM-dependent methyltransferase [Phycisphaeraceae bacterium]